MPLTIPENAQGLKVLKGLDDLRFEAQVSYSTVQRYYTAGKLPRPASIIASGIGSHPGWNEKDFAKALRIVKN